MGQLIDDRLAAHAEKIRELGKRSLRDVIEIGRHLTEAKLLAGHGAWLGWLKREFGWSEMSATRFMRIYDFEREFKSHRLLDLTLNLAALYELTRKRTPPEVVTHFVAKAACGEKVTAREIKEASAVIPFPKREAPPATFAPPVVVWPEIPLPVVVQDRSPSINWQLLNRLENVTYLRGHIENTLEGEIKRLVESGRLPDVIRAAEDCEALASA
jgi:hypothetical protein